ncbi:putative nascent polypeptide-associated complex subunit alpha, muscle-specific form isoform X1 [Apostichopus japonicus]|uniref:Putative nascent polypeptide-associated complex subunit alpha, muscle-specific form isoform X1 n=1 Tax=Stichopus japonicus TaxID=307972 RepID=A0A2G8KSK7_STIJA|nr:putative nascent polypeptide-associated complex subunit alpha, muscle-specific form isoform X1 [Apostichopus japonicus]
MPLNGIVVVIKRSGADGGQFPLTSNQCMFGRTSECDIRIQLPNVSREHCRLDVKPNGEVFVTNLSQVNATTLNKKGIGNPTKIFHRDVFTIVDRSFRFEYPVDSVHRTAHRSSPSRKEVQSPEVTSTTQTTPPNTAGGTPRSSRKKTPMVGKRKLPTPLQPEKVYSANGPTPGKKQATPGRGTPRRVSTPAKKTSTPGKATPKSGKKSGQGKTVASPKDNATPVGQKRTSTRSTPSPAAKKATPAKKAETPQLLKKSPSPAKKTPSPAKKTPTPSRKSRTPARKTPSPAKKTPTPSKKTPSPARRTPTPSKKTPSPAKILTPAKKAPTPAKKAPTPAKKTPSPAKIVTPAKKAPTPAKKHPHQPRRHPPLRRHPHLPRRHLVQLRY